MYCNGKKFELSEKFLKKNKNNKKSTVSYSIRCENFYRDFDGMPQALA